LLPCPLECSIRKKGAIEVADVLHGSDHHCRVAHLGQETRRVPHPAVLEAIDLLPDLVADEAEQRPDALDGFPRPVDGLPKRLFAVVEDGDTPGDLVDTPPLQASPPWRPEHN